MDAARVLASQKATTDKKNTPSWRSNSSLLQPNHVDNLQPGTIHYSPAHIGIGGVSISCLYTFHLVRSLNYCQRYGITPHSSMGLEAVQRTVEHTTEVELLINAVTYFIHPDQYRAMLDLQTKLRITTTDTRILNHFNKPKGWKSILPNITWVLNCLTPRHRDQKALSPAMTSLLMQVLQKHISCSMT